MINNSQPSANYFETTCINSQSVNVRHTSNKSVSLPNPSVNNTYEPQEQLPLDKLYSYNSFMHSSFHQSNIPTSSMPIAQQTFVPNTSASFVYQQLLATNVGPLNLSTVVSAPNSNNVTQPSNVQPFSSEGTIFYVGNPNAIDTAIYSKQYRRLTQVRTNNMTQLHPRAVNQSLIKI